MNPAKRNFPSISLLVICAMLSVASCAASQKYHEYIMRGSVIEVRDSNVYLCIGSRDGAEVGQELDVYKIVLVSRHIHPNDPTKYEKRHTGKIKITEIVNEHFAKAHVVSGTVAGNDIVELSRR